MGKIWKNIKETSTEVGIEKQDIALDTPLSKEKCNKITRLENLESETEIKSSETSMTKEIKTIIE